MKRDIFNELIEGQNYLQDFVDKHAELMLKCDKIIENINKLQNK